MDASALIEALSSPNAYPAPCEAVDVRQTHVSAVFLAGAFACKVKKPVRLPFLDFSGLARLLLGSVADEVVRGGEVPILLHHAADD